MPAELASFHLYDFISVILIASRPILFGHGRIGEWWKFIHLELSGRESSVVGFLHDSRRKDKGLESH